MDTKTFLKTILPSSGLLYVARVHPREGKKAATIHYMAPDVDEAADQLLALDRKYQTDNIYYAMASYKEPRYSTKAMSDGKEFTFLVGRKQDNVQLVKSLWLDIDIGKPDCYATRDEAIAGIKEYLAATGLPTPLMVSSGYGIHCYWVFTESVNAAVWMDVAGLQRAAWQHMKLKADPACDVDAARILRAPGTHNRRPGKDPKLVKVVQPKVNALPVMEIKRRLRKYVEDNKLVVEEFNALRPAWMDGMSANLVAAYPDSYPELVAEHCNQIRIFSETGWDGNEPLWHASLGLVKHCVDGEATAHSWSSNAPGYQPDETQAKLDQWEMRPTTCARFKQLNAEGCNGCQHTCTSPVQLGYKLETKAPDLKVVDELGAKETPKDTTQPVEDVYADESGDGSDVCGWPKDFLYDTQSKTIFQRVTNAQGVVENVPVASPLFYPIEQIRGEDGEYSLRMIVHMLGRRQEFVVSARVLNSDAKLAEELSAMGRVYAINKKGTSKFMSSFLQNLAARREAINTYRQMGWHHDGQAFLLGDTLITEKGEHKVVVSSKVAERLAGAHERRGTAEEWSHAVNELYNRPNAEPYQFAICAAFAAPLHAIHSHIFSEWKGIPFALTSEESGYAKTTVSKIACSIWLNPEKAIVSQSTPKAVLGITSAFGNVPYVLDEVTQYLSKPEEMAELLYALSNGQPREGMTVGGQLRDRLPAWQSVVPMTGNRKIIQQVTENKLNPEALQVRVFEIDLDTYPRIDSMVKGSAAYRRDGERLGEIAKELPSKCCGVIGPEYVRFIMAHREEVEAKLRKTALALGKDMGDDGDSTKERFYYHLVTTVLVGGYYAKKLGYINFSLNHLRDWCIRHIAKLREARAMERRGPEDLFADMMSDLAAGVIVTRNFAGIDGRSDATQSHMGGSLRTPITGRYVIGGGNQNERPQLYLTAKAVKDWCKDNGVMFSSARRDLIHAGILRTDHPECAVTGGRRVCITRGVKDVPSIGSPTCFEFRIQDAAAIGLPENNVLPMDRKAPPADDLEIAV